MITNLTLFVALMQFGSMMQMTPIEGHVRDTETRKALAMVRIELFERGIPIATTYTDPDGRFRFMNVFPGRYALYVDLAEYQPQSVDIDGMTSWGVDVQLNRKRERIQTPPTVSLNDLPKSHGKLERVRQFLKKLKEKRG